MEGPGAAGRLTNASGKKIAFTQIKNPEKWMKEVAANGVGIGEQQELLECEQVMVFFSFSCVFLLNLVILNAFFLSILNCDRTLYSLGVGDVRVAHE